MSKIMKQLYAEARAAREAASGSGGSRLGGVTPAVANPPAPAKSMVGQWKLPLPEPVTRAKSTIEWWTLQLAKAAESCTSPRSDGPALRPTTACQGESA